MPNITSLTVLEVTGPWAGLGHAIPVRDLQELSVTGDAPVLSGLFNHLRFQALKSATVHFTFPRGGQVAPADITASLSLFYNAVSTSSLHNLQLVHSPMLSSGRELPALCELIAPILPIRDLRTFSLSANFDTITMFDNADVEALARAWPNMEHLFIDRGPTSESSVSFNALHYLHRHCIHLKELSIPRLRWPVIGVHSIPAPLLGQLTSHPLRRLAVRNEYLLGTIARGSLGPELSDEDEEAMARYLLDLFPQLEPEQYKGAAELEDDSSSDFRQRKKQESILGFDGRWRKVSGRMYRLCCPRDGL